MLVGLGLLLVTGVWTDVVSSMQGWISGFEVAV
jgi:cytochrome c-type biogenesis protein